MFSKGIKDGIPIALGYLSVSFTFGLAAVGCGLKVWQAVLISITNLTSAGQFAGLDIMAAGGGMLEMAFAQLVINIRYSLMSISLSQKADSSMTRFWRLILGYGITDEIFAVAVGQNETVGRKYLSGLIITPVLGWTLGTFLGAFLGNILPEIVINALGVAIYAMFLAIILPPARENLKVMVVVIAAVVLSCVMFYVPWLKEHISLGTSIIIAAVISATLGAVFFPIRDEQKE